MPIERDDIVMRSGILLSAKMMNEFVKLVVYFNFRKSSLSKYILKKYWLKIILTYLIVFKNDLKLNKLNTFSAK